MKTRPLFVAIVILPAFCVAGAFAQSAPATGEARPQRSVTILFDLSYSMRLPISLNKDDIHGPTRLQEAKALVRTLLDHAPEGTEWALLTFGGQRSGGFGTAAQVRQEFTTSTARVKEALSSLSTWGTTPLASALLSGERYSAGEARGRNRTLLVISDGIATTPDLFAMPAAEKLRSYDTRLVFAAIAPRESPGLTVALRDWVSGSGGIYARADDARSVERALEASASPPAATSAGSQAAQGGHVASGQRATGGRPAVDVESPEPKGSGEVSAERAGRPSAEYLFLLIIPVPMILFGLLVARRKRELDRVESKRVKHSVLLFDYESRGDSKVVEIDQLPAELVAGAEAAGATTEPLIDLRNNTAILAASEPVLVNGVAVRRAGLTAGDRIHTGSSTWTFTGVEHRVEGPAGPAAVNPVPYIAVTALLAVCATVLLLVLTPIAAPAEGGKLAARQVASTARRGEQTSTSGGSPAEASSSQNPDSHGSALPEPAAGASLVALYGSPRKVDPLVHTRMIPPGGKPQFFKADIMFIHAHPDDESIDFGGLMALEARAGRRIVTVIFTDGTAGLDQYPNRGVGGMYPAHSLSGQPLAEVRVREAEGALSILGSQEYVRLGLRNNPYNSLKEILPLHEVLRRWGGEARVVQELVDLIEGFRPDVVVSPDEQHRGVFKHFEHEAVGYVTDKALEYLTSRGTSPVRAHLVAVDPMLTGQYRDVFGVDVMAVDPRSRLTYRAIQVAALKEHASQRDASVIGVEVVPNFSEEYYVPRFWNLPVSPSEYFAPPEG